MNVYRIFTHSLAIHWNFVKVSSNPPNKYNGRYNCSSLLHMKKTWLEESVMPVFSNITQSIGHQVSGKVSQKNKNLEQWMHWLTLFDLVEECKGYYRHIPRICLVAHL